MKNRPTYIDALIHHLETVGVEPGTVTHLEVRHDAGCAIWSRRSCDCEPEVESGARVDDKFGGPQRGDRP